MSTRRRRSEEHSLESRQALVDSATRFFADRGYAQTSLDEIAERARLSKGSVYWHFGSKQALFRAVLEELERDVVERLSRTAAAAPDPWSAAQAALTEFLDICCGSAYGRVVMREGPVALTYAEWRDCMERHSFGLTRALLTSLVDEGVVDPLPLDAWARIAHGQLGTAAVLIAEAEGAHQAEVRRDVEVVLVRMLSGLRPSSIDR